MTTMTAVLAFLCFQNSVFAGNLDTKASSIKWLGEKLTGKHFGSLTFTDGAFVDVYLNGVLLKPTTDYNTSTANTIAGISAMAASDEVTVVVYDVFAVGDTVSAVNGGTFSGAVTAGTSIIIGSADLNETDLEKLDGITDGTGAANKALVLDANSNIGTINRLTASHAKIGVLDVDTINSVTTTATDLEVSDRRIVAALSASSANADGGGLRIGGGDGDARGRGVRSRGARECGARGGEDRRVGRLRAGRAGIRGSPRGLRRNPTPCCPCASRSKWSASSATKLWTVSYTHLTLPTNREV